MQCPKCKEARTYVTTSKAHESGGVFRYRTCSGCDFHFVTLESVLEDTPKLGRPALGTKTVRSKTLPNTKPEPKYKGKPKLKATLTRQDQDLIKKIKIEIRHKFEDMRADKEE